MTATPSSIPGWGTPVTRESVATMRAVRDRFLSDPQGQAPAVRDVIARSWTRSAACKVDPDHIYSEIRDVQLDATFMRVALPVVERLGQMASDTGACVILSDASGTHAIMRGDREVLRWADAQLALIGGHMPEDLAGTNSDGTALEEGRSVQVWGAEHYSVALQNTYCTSVPIHDSLRRRIAAVLTLMVPERVALATDPSSLALIVEGAAAEISRLAADRLASRERALLQAYMQESRTRGGEAVLASDGRTTIASARAQQLLTPNDFAVVSGYANEATAIGATLDHVVSFAGNRSVLLTAKPVIDDGDIVGAVVRFRERTESGESGAHPGGSIAKPIPELIGDSAVITQVRLAAVSALSQDSVVYLTGERGTGRTLLAGLMARELTLEPCVVECDETQRAPAAEPLAAELRAAVEGGRPIIARHVDQISEVCRDEVHELLRSASAKVRTFLTAAHVTADSLHGFFSISVQEVRLPPLRSRRDDIPRLVDHFLAELRPDRRVTAAPQLLGALAKADWPGNVADLRDVILSAAAAVESGELTTAHLGEFQRKAITRGRLTRLEAAELEQIRHALIESRGNRARAAQLLEIGRSTLYRKIDLYSRRGFDLGA